MIELFGCCLEVLNEFAERLLDAQAGEAGGRAGGPALGHQPPHGPQVLVGGNMQFYIINNSSF